MNIYIKSFLGTVAILIVADCLNFLTKNFGLTEPYFTYLGFYFAGAFNQIIFK